MGWGSELGKINDEETGSEGKRKYRSSSSERNSNFARRIPVELPVFDPPSMLEAAQKSGDADRMQLWAGQSAKLAQDAPAGILCHQLWEDATRFLV